MKSVDEKEAKARLEEILEEAQRQPIMIRRRGRNHAVVVSLANYERLRVGVVHNFLDLRNDIAGEATAAGLTANRLSELLNND